MVVSVGNLVFLSTSTVLLPLYLFIISKLFNVCNSLKNSMYYWVVVSYSIVDTASVFFFITCLSLSEFSSFESFFWNSRRTYFPVLCHAQLFFFLIAKTIGIQLIAMQRILELYCPKSTIYRVWSCGPCFFASVLQWLLSLIIAWPFLIQMNVNFVKKSNKLSFELPQEEYEFNFYFITIFCLLGSASSLIMYGISFLKFGTTKRMDAICTLISFFASLPLHGISIYLVFCWSNNKLDPSIFYISSPFTVLNTIFSYSHLLVFIANPQVCKIIFALTNK